MFCNDCPGMTIDTCGTVGRCGDPRDNARLREWFENALGIPILQGYELGESPGGRGEHTTVVVEETA